MSCVPVTFVWLLLAVVGCCSGSDVSTAAASVRLVHAFWRHGDRSPTERYWPTDTVNTEASWPQGWAELTGEGIQQQYALGRYLQQRYTRLVGQHYSRDEVGAPFWPDVYIASTDVNRTIMSAQANLAGMFPPDDRQKWSADLSWQPVPVHTIADDHDPIHAACPNLAKESERVDRIHAEEISRLDKVYSPWYSFVSEKTGTTVNSFRTFANNWDPICCLLAHVGKEDSTGRHVMPTWLNDTIIQQVKQAYDLTYKFRWASDALKQIKVGPLLSDMITRMEQKRTGGDSYKLKYFALSGHDTSVAPLLQSLSATEVVPRQPPYAAVILVELHQKARGSWTVELYYRNKTDDDAAPTQLHIAGCPSPCSLQQFKQAMQHMIPADWAKACGRTSWWQRDAYRIIILLLVFVCALLVLQLVMCKRLSTALSPNQPIVYQPLNQTPIAVLSDDDEEESPVD